MSSELVHTIDSSLPQTLKSLKSESKRPSVTHLTREQLVETTSSILQEMIEQRGSNFSDVCEISHKTIFHAQKLPSLSIKAYLQRFSDHSSCKDDAFILAMIYLDKVGELLDTFTLDSFNVHRIILVCLTLACKYNDDYYYKNSYYSKIGGVKLEEFNKLEQEFLMDYIQFSLYVDPKTYQEYCEDLLGYYQDKLDESEDDS